MAEFSIRSDGVDVEQIMRQIRARIRAKRGADYTEDEIRRLANAKLETFLDSSRVRSELLDAFRRAHTEEPPPNFAFEDHTIFDTHRPLLRFVRRLLRPVLKLFFNPNPIAEALHIQSELNAKLAGTEPLYYELIHNLVVEVTRLGIEVRNMNMKVESIASRLDFDERRARALEGAVQYRPGALQARPLGERPAEGSRPEGGRAVQPTGETTEGEGPADRRKRRRRRGRRRSGVVPGPPGGGAGSEADAAATGRGSVEGGRAPAEAETTPAGDESSDGRDRPEPDPDTP
jgi:hypothetical protein